MSNSGSGWGPGALVTAAFIGPGTVTVCTLAGVNDGYSLLWVMLLSVAVCFLLQEMAARLGMVSRQGLAEVVRSEISRPLLRLFMIVIMLSAIVVGNAAYEAGNLSGAVLGIGGIAEVGGTPVMTVVIAALALGLLLSGSYRLLERVLIALVAVMSLAFVLVAMATRPEISAIARGLVPSMSSSQTLTVIGLVGTTVVPYNLFLHARIVQEKWSGAGQLAAMRKDALLAISLGGLVSMCIIIAGAALQGSGIRSAAELAMALQPLFGEGSCYIMAFGLFAAGLTSAITAPLAAGYVATGCLGQAADLKSTTTRAVWVLVLGAGLLFSLLGGSPVEIIRFAQVTNGILLPLTAGFVLWAVNRKTLLGEHANTGWQNLLGIVVLLAVTLLAVRSLWLVWQSLT